MRRLPFSTIFCCEPFILIIKHSTFNPFIQSCFAKPIEAKFLLHSAVKTSVMRCGQCFSCTLYGASGSIDDSTKSLQWGEMHHSALPPPTPSFAEIVYFDKSFSPFLVFLHSTKFFRRCPWKSTNYGTKPDEKAFMK